MQISGSATSHQIALEGSCSASHRAHWTKATEMERAMAKQSWAPHFGQFGPLLHANLPPHSVSLSCLGKEEN
jgi:hypothetical protein